MFRKVREFFRNLLTKDSIQSNLESYIASHNPQTVQDVDRLEREYMQTRFKSLGYFG